MKRLLLHAAVGASLLGTARPAHAWDELGHKVIARIAWEHMTDGSRRAAVELLRAAPEASGLRELLVGGGPGAAVHPRDAFTAAATWADLIRDPSHPGHAHSAPDWHYVNWLWAGQGETAAARNARGPGMLVGRLRLLRHEIVDPARPASDRAVRLAWLLHLVGDIHQPLHNSARISRGRPEGDRGGNLVRLDRGRTLHAFWDELLGPPLRWSVPPAYNDDRIGWIARVIVSRHSARDMAASMRDPDPAGWSREALRIAQVSAYPRTLRAGRAPSRAYRDRAARIAERQAALAGYRLSALLNELLDPGLRQRPLPIGTFPRGRGPE